MTPGPYPGSQTEDALRPSRRRIGPARGTDSPPRAGDPPAMQRAIETRPRYTGSRAYPQTNPARRAVRPPARSMVGTAPSAASASLAFALAIARLRAAREV